MPKLYNRLIGDTQHFWTHYLSWEEFLKAAEAKPQWGSFHDGNSWAGLSLPRALELARYGWPKGRARMKAVSEKLEVKLRSTVQSSRYAEDRDVSGFRPDVPLFLTGAPDHMVSPGDQTIAQAPILRLQINIDSPMAVSGSAMENQAIAVASLCDALENQGYSCELRLANATYGKNPRSLTMFTCAFKSAGEPLDPDQAVFALGHPAVLRNLLFSIYRSDLAIQARFPGYGAPVAEIPEDYTDPDMINIPPADFECTSAEHSMRRLVRIIKGSKPDVNWRFLEILLLILDDLINEGNATVH